MTTEQRWFVAACVAAAVLTSVGMQVQATPLGHSQIALR
jgi:hypothetical protein